MKYKYVSVESKIYPITGERNTVFGPFLTFMAGKKSKMTIFDFFLPNLVIYDNWVEKIWDMTPLQSACSYDYKNHPNHQDN